jgi:hypothetical protein
VAAKLDTYEKMTGTLSLPSCLLHKWVRSGSLEATESSQPSEAELKWLRMSCIAVFSVTMLLQFCITAVTALQQPMGQNVMKKIPLPIFVEMCDHFLVAKTF